MGILRYYDGVNVFGLRKLADHLKAGTKYTGIRKLKA
jgi:hypothetical protein